MTACDWTRTHVIIPWSPILAGTGSTCINFKKMIYITFGVQQEPSGFFLSIICIHNLRWCLLSLGNRKKRGFGCVIQERELHPMTVQYERAPNFLGFFGFFSTFGWIFSLMGFFLTTFFSYDFILARFLHKIRGQM